MGFQLMRVYPLVLIPVCIILILYLSKLAVRVNKKKLRIVMLLRCIVITFIILSICGTSFYWTVRDITTIFVVDNSDSIGSEKGEFEGFVKEALNYKNDKDSFGIVAFGANSEVESFISKEKAFAKIEGQVNGNFTNIENALTSSMALFPNNTNKRIVLISDGEENIGSINNIISSFKDQDIELKYFEKKTKDNVEVAVEGLVMPQKLVIDEEFNLVVTIKSTSDTSGKLSLFNGREKVGEQQVEISKGINKFVFKNKATAGGFKEYKVMLESQGDTELKNNEASAYTVVTAKPKVLIVEDKQGEGREISQMLKASSIDYSVINSKEAPRTLAEMSSFKSIILCNVSAENLNKGFMDNLDSYVKDFGGGLIAAGGDNSFALGGYAKTSLEKVLPVYMDLRGKKEIPKMSMMLIIDKSGSMTEGIAGISKVEMAKEAAIRSLSSLRVGKDEIGVLTFDGEYSWAVKRQIINDVKAIENDIGSIRADGGTSILPALEEGFKSLKDSDAKIKHIILLTDGQAERSGYNKILDEMNKANVTVSTVAVGRDADQSLLSSIAKQCGGRFYVTDEYTNIPNIFSKETFMAAKLYLNNREFTPIISSTHSILKSVAENGLPSLLGYIASTQKETARMILKSDEDDPILTTWQYGLGKTVAWNSDINGKWSGNYIPWDKNIKLWQNIINYTIENYDDENLSIEMKQVGNKGEIILKNKNFEKELETEATIVTPSGESIDLKLLPSSPGEYSGEIDLQQSGVYMISGKQLSANGELVSSATTGFVQQYSPEYKIKDGENNTMRIVEASGGKIISSAKEVFSSDIVKKKGQRDLAPFLLSVALILLMVDIAIRRLSLNAYKISRLLDYRLSFVDKFFKKVRTTNTNEVKEKIDLSKFKVNISNSKTRNKGGNKPVYDMSEYKEVKVTEIKEEIEVKKEEKISTDIEGSSNLDTVTLLKNKRRNKK